MGVFKILAIEDDVDHAVLIKAVLSSGISGCDVRVAPSGEAAKAYLETPTPKDGPGHGPRPGLIILDMWLGDMSGLEVLEWLSVRPQFSGIPVIVFTSSADPDLARQCYALGARRFVMKPMNFQDLVKVVHEVVPMWAQERAPSVDAAEAG